MQAAAMRRIEAGRAAATSRKRTGQARQRPALGAVAVNDVDRLCLDATGDFRDGDQIARRRSTGERQPGNAERGALLHLCQALAPVGTGILIIDDEADAMTALRQRLAQIGDVSKQPADRRAQDLQDIERPGIHQN